MNNNRNNIQNNSFWQPDDDDRKASGATIPGGIQRGRRISTSGAPLPLLISDTELEATYQQFHTLVVEAEQAYQRVETVFREDEQHYRQTEQRYREILQQCQTAENSYITACNNYQNVLKAKSQNPSVSAKHHATHRGYIQARETYQEAIKTSSTIRENCRAAREAYKHSMQSYHEVEETYLEILHLSYEAREAYVAHLETSSYTSNNRATLTEQ